MEWIEASHFRDVCPGQWKWTNFRPSEFACRGEPGQGSVKIAVALLDKLQALRDVVGRPMVVTSGYRSPGYNRTLPGAAAHSLHVQGTAVDISMGNFLSEEAEFHRQAKRIGFTGFGFYPEYRNIFMHLDLGPPRWWGDPKPWSIAPL